MCTENNSNEVNSPKSTYSYNFYPVGTKDESEANNLNPHMTNFNMYTSNIENNNNLNFYNNSQQNGNISHFDYVENNNLEDGSFNSNTSNRVMNMLCDTTNLHQFNSFFEREQATKRNLNINNNVNGTNINSLLKMKVGTLIDDYEVTSNYVKILTDGNIKSVNN